MPENHKSERWKPRKIAAGLVGWTIALGPVIASVGVAIAFGRSVPAPDTVVGFGAWWLATIALCTLVFLGAEMVMRRMLPFAILLKMDMAFPGQAPRRLAIARRAASVRDLDRKVQEAKIRGALDEPTAAAERIVTLATTLSVHDRATRGHAERVRALTDMMAEELHLTPSSRDRLRWSSLLHDIGKLTVHAHVLNKTEVLSDEEWAVIKRHPLEGARLTAPLSKWLGEWAATIAQHHERFDGKGYPYGLSGRHISLGARIVAVADSYDVMTSMRSYKRPMSPDKARQELARCAGSQFDPDIVRAFLAVSVWRLRLAAPISWLGSISSAKVVGAATRISAVAGHSLAAGAAATIGVMSVAVLGPIAAKPPGATSPQVSAHVAEPATSVSPFQIGSSPGKPGGSSAPAGQPGTNRKAPVQGAVTGKASKATGGTSPPRATTSTTTGAGHSVGPRKPTPVVVPTATTTTTSTTTTTTTTLPVPLPPSGLTATGACQVVLIGPVVALEWTASPSPSVTSYTILRKQGGGAYAPVARVGSGTTSYSDTSVTGLDTSYTYEVQANGPGGSAVSGSASATTPSLCI
ncbi:MAG: HD domain-containing phosphohydrolase [Acidimicrobiales bacterium]